MAGILLLDEESPRVIRFHHGTDRASADELLRFGVDAQRAAAWNGSGEFWATLDPGRAKWFALSHPNSPPGACFEFELLESQLRAILRLSPTAAVHHLPNDYEFLSASHVLLNRYMTSQRIVAVC